MATLEESRAVREKQEGASSLAHTELQTRKSPNKQVQKRAEEIKSTFAPPKENQHTEQ